jgi:hypothetical protein
MFGRIYTKRKNGTEPFCGAKRSKLQDYWAWAHSDLVANTERGVLAEYIVGLSLGCLGEVRTEWDAYDLLTTNGVKVEVKASGYIQTWEQKNLSSPYFGIRKTYGSQDGGATFVGDKRRQADVYVFCVHAHSDQKTVNALDLSQWEFYVLSSRVLDEKVPEKKSIGLPLLLKIGAMKAEWDGLTEAVDAAMA